MLKQYLKKIDILDKPFSLSLNKSTSFKTVTGGVLTFLVALVGCTLFSILGQDFILQNDPKLVSSKVKQDTSYFSLKELSLVFGVFDGTATPLHNTAFSKAIEFKADILNFGTFNGKTNISWDRLLIERCSKDHLTREAAEYYSNLLRLDTFLCVNPNKFLRNNEIVEEEILIKNELYSEGSASFSLRVNKCSSTEEGCDELFATQPQIYVTYYMNNHYFNANKGKQGINLNVKGYSISVNTVFSVRDTFSFNLTQVKIDEGYMFKQIFEADMLKMSEKNSEVIGYEPTVRNLYQVFIESQTLVDEISVSYTKIQELLAYLSGFVKVGMIGCNLLAYFSHDYAEIVQLKRILAKESTKQVVSNMTIRQNSSSFDLNRKSDSAIKFTFWTYLFHKLGLSKSKEIDTRKLLQVKDLACIRKEIEELKVKMESLD